MQKSYWHYWQRWRQLFPRQRDVHLEQGVLVNAYCQDCRYCCGPQDCAAPFPMKLLPSQQHAHLDRDFFLLAPDTACLDGRGCKSCGPDGCRLPRPQRPVACGLFPLVLLDTGLYLYKVCPAVLFLPLDRWLGLAYAAAGWLAGLGTDTLARIAVHLPETTVRERFIDLELPLPFPSRTQDPAMPDVSRPSTEDPLPSSSPQELS